MNLINFGVFYDNQLKGTFNNELVALRYVRKQKKDPNANIRLFSIKQL